MRSVLEWCNSWAIHCWLCEESIVRQFIWKPLKLVLIYKIFYGQWASNIFIGGFTNKMNFKLTDNFPNMLIFWFYLVTKIAQMFGSKNSEYDCSFLMRLQFRYYFSTCHLQCVKPSVVNTGPWRCDASVWPRLCSCPNIFYLSLRSVGTKLVPTERGTII